MNIINEFINSIENETFNKIRNSKSDAEARRILKENNLFSIINCNNEHCIDGIVGENYGEKNYCGICENGYIKKELSYKDISKGMRVVDKYGDSGYISKIENAYNIYVKYDNCGSAIFCLNDCCKDVLYTEKV